MALQGVDDPELVLWRHPGVDGRVEHGTTELLVVHGVDLLAGQRALARAGDAEVRGDARRRAGMVAGDHHGADTGAMGLGYGVTGLVAGWVDDADDAEEHEPGLRGLVELVRSALARLGDRIGNDVAVGNSQRAIRVARQPLDGAEEAAAVVPVERDDLVSHAHPLAVFEEDVGRPLDEEAVLIGLDVVAEDRHHLAL